MRIVALIALLSTLAVSLAGSVRESEALDHSQSLKPSPAAAPKASGLLQGWHLVQDSKTMGAHDIFICKQAIRIVNKNTSFAVISKAPAWTIVCLNDRNKSYCPSVLERLNHEVDQTLAMFGGAVLADIPLQAVKAKYPIIPPNAEMELERYEEPPGFEKKQMKLLKSKEVSQNTPIKVQMDSWKTDFPLIESRIITRLYGLPTATKGIPLSFSTENENYKRHHELTTYKAVRTQLSPALFSVPKDYRLAQSLEQLKKDKSTDESINSMLQHLGNQASKRDQPAR